MSVLPTDPKLRLPEGSQLVFADDLGDYTGEGLPEAPIPMQGHVTSSYDSQALGRTFGLALIKNGPSLIGQKLMATCDGGFAEVEGGPAADGLEKVLGAPLPRKVGQVSKVETPVTGHVLWFGPDDFLLVAGDEAERELSCSALAGILAEAVGEHRGQTVDLSGNRTVLELSGPNAVDVLCRMVEVDVHPDFFPVGSAILTLVAGSSAALWRTGEDSYWIMPRASFADHTANWLLDAMREFADRD